MTESPDGRPLDSPDLFCRDFAAVLDARGVSVREAAERSNWSKSAIGNARTGPRLPRAELVTTVLAAVGVPEVEVRGWARRHAALAAAPASPATAPARSTATVSADVMPPSAGAPAAPEVGAREAGGRTTRAVVVAVLVTGMVSGAAGWFTARAASTPTAAGPVVVTVQNKVALGAEDLVEDSGPVYLSSRAIAFCGTRGCREDGTDVVSGALLSATCTVVGERMWNYNLDSPAVRNPHGVESASWYRVSWPDGRSGYLSEVYLEPASRGGLGLPACS
ncbi:helix-turn-helix transcriptional regulator [Pseudonocardia sp. ICBG1122]|nr:helix-turn-helix transcriptional regulator [Pseudonocardia pini]